MVEHLYRYETRWTCGIDEWDEPTASHVHSYLSRFPIIKETPKGYWVGDYGRKRWVSNTTRKRFAHRTEAEAAEALRQRKISYVRHQKARLRKAENELALAETLCGSKDKCSTKLKLGSLNELIENVN